MSRPIPRRVAQMPHGGRVLSPGVPVRGGSRKGVRVWRGRRSTVVRSRCDGDGAVPISVYIRKATLCARRMAEWSVLYVCMYAWMYACMYVCMQRAHAEISVQGQDGPFIYLSVFHFYFRSCRICLLRPAGLCTGSRLLQTICSASCCA